MNNDEELEIIDAFEDDDRTKEFVPAGVKKETPGRRETRRRTRTNDTKVESKEVKKEDQAKVEEKNNRRENKIKKEKESKEELEKVDVVDNKIEKKLSKKKRKTKKESKTSKDDKKTKEEINIQKSDTTKKTVKKLKKVLLAQTIFCMVSIFFIIGCFIYYGNRFIKYYRIYNPKDSSGNTLTLLTNKITSSSKFVYEGDGLYLINGNYLYKGSVKNNYIEYSGLLWRVLKINEDKTIDLVLDSNINVLKWNNTISEYKESDINKYLEEEFLPLINNNNLTKTTICKDIINDVDSISCNDIDQTSYIRLLNIDEYLNSKANNNSFLSDGSNIWLSSRGKNKVWVINDKNVSFANPANTYYIKPVITLKNSTALISGSGTKDDPYIIEENKNDKLKLGTHIKLDKDIWTVYKIDKNKLYLVLTNVLNKTYRFDLKTNEYNPTSKYSLAEYLNNSYLNSLSYKNKLLEFEVEIGNYTNSYKDIESSKTKVKVGIPSIKDFKFEHNESYFLINGTANNNIYMFNELLLESKVDLYRNIKPTICIKKTKVVSGDGTIENPFVLGE